MAIADFLSAWRCPARAPPAMAAAATLRSNRARRAAAHAERKFGKGLSPASSGADVEDVELGAYHPEETRYAEGAHSMQPPGPVYAQYEGSRRNAPTEDEPNFCMKLCCPLCAVLGHQGSIDGGDICGACCCGCWYTVFLWQPKNKDGTVGKRPATMTAGAGAHRSQVQGAMEVPTIASGGAMAAPVLTPGGMAQQQAQAQYGMGMSQQYGQQPQVYAPQGQVGGYAMPAASAPVQPVPVSPVYAGGAGGTLPPPVPIGGADPAAGGSGKNFCGNCGAAVTPGQRFCSSCGKQI